MVDLTCTRRRFIEAIWFTTRTVGNEKRELEETKATVRLVIKIFFIPYFFTLSLPFTSHFFIYNTLHSSFTLFRLFSYSIYFLFSFFFFFREQVETFARERRFLEANLVTWKNVTCGKSVTSCCKIKEANEE